ncbi:unnamed protein product [Pedinophyceae sp. YPF-701]|nr:unnamed protein product [Pedinophyceae sp. YPF-701]
MQGAMWRRVRSVGAPAGGLALLDCIVGVTAAGRQLQANFVRIEYEDRRDITNGFNTWRGGFDPSTEGYWGSLAWVALPFYALAIVSFLAWFFFFLTRFCCCFCGKSFCPAGKREGYSSRQRGVLRAAILMTTAVIFVGASFIWLSSTGIKDDVSEGFVGTVAAQIDRLELSAVQISAGADAAAANLDAGADDPNLQQLRSQINSVVPEVTRVTSKIKGQRENVDEAFERIYIATLCVSAIVAGLAVVGAVGAVFNLPTFLATAAAFFPFFLLISFLLGGTGLMLHTFWDDMCMEGRGVAADPTTAQARLQTFFPCPDPSIVDNAILQSKTVANAMILEMNSRLEAEYSNPQWSPQPTRSIQYMCEPYDRNSLQTNACPLGAPPADAPVPQRVRAGQFPERFGEYRCTASTDRDTCAQDARLLDGLWLSLRGKDNATRTVIDTFTTPTGGALAPLAYLSGCSVVAELCVEVVENDCDAVDDALFYFWVGFSITALGLIVGSVVFVLGVQRLPSYALRVERVEDDTANLPGFDGRKPRTRAPGKVYVEGKAKAGDWREAYG